MRRGAGKPPAPFPTEAPASPPPLNALSRRRNRFPASPSKEFCRLPPAIETRALTKRFRSGWFGKPVTALDSLDLVVEPGEIFGFLGANGAGKTTTIKLLLRLSFPTSGEAFLLGHRVPHTSTRARIGYLPENPYFYDYATPDELLSLYADLLGLSGALRDRRIGEALERVRMTKWRKTPIRNFSKGMTQRIGVAQALLNDPELLFLDEPTSGLDPVGRSEMRDLILDLRAAGKTVFLNSHLLSELENICDRVAILRQGRMARQGHLNELLALYGFEIVAENAPPALGDEFARAGLETETIAGRLTVDVTAQSDIRGVVERIFHHGAALVRVAPRRERLEDLFLQIEQEGQTSDAEREKSGAEHINRGGAA